MILLHRRLQRALMKMGPKSKACTENILTGNVYGEAQPRRETDAQRRARRRFQMFRMLTALAILLGLPALLLSAAAAPAGTKEGDGVNRAIVGSSSAVYKFDYRSYATNDARVYEVRNMAGGVLTTVNWTAGDETLLKLGIPRCKNEIAPCNWITTKHPFRAWKVGDTELAYGGPNIDEQNEKPRGVKEDSDAKASSTTYRPLTTTLKGEIAGADEDGPTIAVDLTVTSLISSELPNTFIYKVERGKDDDTKEFTFSTKAVPRNKGIQVIWHSLAKLPKERLRYSPKDDKETIKDAELPAVVSQDRTSLTVEAKVAGEISTDRGLLEILQDGKPVAANTAPAYRPKE